MDSGGDFKVDFVIALMLPLVAHRFPDKPQIAKVFETRMWSSSCTVAALSWYQARIPKMVCDKRNFSVNPAKHHSGSKLPVPPNGTMDFPAPIKPS